MNLVCVRHRDAGRPGRRKIFEGRDGVAGVADIGKGNIGGIGAVFQPVPGPVLPLVRRGFVAPVAGRRHRFEQGMTGQIRPEPFQPAEPFAGLAVRNTPDGMPQPAADIVENRPGVRQRNTADQEQFAVAGQAFGPGYDVGHG